MTNYTITISDTERRQLADALALFVQKLTNAQLQIEQHAPSAPPAHNPAAAPAVDKPQPRDRWARDRKGNEVPNPEGCEAHTVHLWKAEIVKRKDADKTSFMKLAWDAENGRGSVDASCFDVNLFPYCLAALRHPSVTLYTVRNGNYLNVVGVRA